MFSAMPVSINFSFNFGIALLITFILLLLTGFLSVFFYSNTLETSFFCLILTSFNNFNYFFLRVAHNTFANFFFLFIYFHIIKSWFYSWLNNFYVVALGLVIYFLSCAIAFFGYCLPMGQMWFWAAIVIFSLLTVLPFGNLIILYLFGSFSISWRTLSILFFLHFICPFILLVLIFWHLLVLHSNLSSTTNDFLDIVFMLPIFVFIDAFVTIMLLLLYVVIIFFFWFSLFETANFLAFNSLVTPLHIYPDWFLLFPYACLRSVDWKPIGVILLVIIIVLQFFLPWILSFFRGSNNFIFFSLYLFFLFIVLTFCGAHPSVYPYNVLVLVAQFLVALTVFIAFVLSFFNNLLWY
jgi:ubiquinol-cytochrome c reductase cytochrome b subunit